MSYFGGKAQDGVYQTIINQIPLHDNYIEPFLGGGAIMIKKKPASNNIGIDMDIRALKSLPHLDNIQLLKKDSIQFLSTIDINAFRGSTFIYCDPPYPFSTRGKTRYRHELTDEQHFELLEITTKLDCMVAISTYPNDMYSEYLNLFEWRLLEFNAVNRAGQVTTEHLYMNYEQPTILHDDSYIGENANSRQDIKRRIARTKKRLLSWNPEERVKLLKTLLADLPEVEQKHLLEQLSITHR